MRFSFINSSHQTHSTPIIERTRVKPFVLRPPTPIATTLSVTAFGAVKYDSRLFINGIEKDFLSATISAPHRSLGKSLEINLAKADLAELPTDATFKFQIIKKIGGVEYPITILDGAKLLGKNYSVSFERDSLSFTTVESLSDKLTGCPINNLIVFDGNRVSVSTEEVETLATNTGEFITTSSRDLRPLTLYKLLNIAFVEGCGFSSVVTNIPNSEILRCDFSVAATYLDAVSPFLGIWEPEFSEKNGVLQILTPYADLPAGFVIRTLPNAKILSWSQSSQSEAARIDGYNLRYMAKPNGAFQDRDLPDKEETTGEPLDDNRTVTTIKTTVREWFEGGRVVDSKVIKEVRTTVSNDSVFPSAIETETYEYDRQGRSLGYTKTSQNRMPNVSLDGAPDTLTTREEKQTIEYSVQPFNTRQMYQSRIVTTVKELLAVDSDNTALDKNGDDSPFKQSYAKVFEAGDLKKEMTMEFLPYETTTEAFEPMRGGQIRYRHTIYDNLLEKQKSSFTDVRSGDISVSNYLKQVSYPIFKEGVTQATRTGKPVPDFNAGELPFFFAETLVTRKLAMDATGKQFEIPGFDESIERGVLFNHFSRGGENLGNFLTGGYRIAITPNSIKTTLDAIKI